MKLIHKEFLEEAVATRYRFLNYDGDYSKLLIEEREMKGTPWTKVLEVERLRNEGMTRQTRRNAYRRLKKLGMNVPNTWKEFNEITKGEK